MSYRAVALGSAAVLLALSGQTAAAQTAEDQAQVENDELVVTAQRREQRLQDVALSVSAIGGEDLRELGVTRAIDVVTLVPGIQASGAGGGTVNAFNIRGVTQNAFAASLESPIAVYLDDSYITVNSITNLSLFDIDRVEVLRGPQGTLFGRNATGGVVRYITARPTDEPEGFATLDVGEQGRLRFEGATSGALSEGVNYRLSAVRNYDDGLMENRIGRNAMQTDDWGVRGQIGFEQGRLDGSVKLQYLYEDSNRGGYAHVVAAGGQYVNDPLATDAFGYREPDDDPFTASLDYPGWNNNEVYDLTGTFSYDFDGFTLVSITNFQDIYNDYAEDSDVSPNSVYHYNRGAEVQQFSQELRAEFEAGNVRGLLGAYYLNIDGFFYTNQTGDGFFGGDTERATLDQTTTSLAVFGQVEVEFSPALSAEFGLRYSSDEKDYSYDSTNIFNIFAPGPFTNDTVFEDDGISARAQLNYRLSEDHLLYFGVNRGIKTGGLNFPLFPQDPAFFPFQGEVLTDYEGGWKASLGARTTLNVSVFYYDYDGYQAFSFDGLATRVINTDATMRGAEVEWQTSPIDGLELHFGASYLDNEVTNVPLAVSDGTEVAPFAPKWTVNGLLRYSWNLGAGSMRAQLDGSWRDDQNFNLVPTPVVEEPAYALFNARLGYEADTGWSAAVYVRNLFDEEYRTSSFDTSGDWGALEDMPGPRRWYGAQIGYRW